MAGPPATRTAILEAAESIFGERGFAKTTLEDVAVAARVSRPLVYRYFGDKRTLFAQVLERVLREWNEVLLAEAAREAEDTAETLRLVLAACLDFARSRTVLRGLLVRDAGLVRAAAGGVLERGRRQLPALVRQILERGVASGDVRSDLDLDDMTHVVSEVFVAYALLVLSGERERLGRRRSHAVIETLLYGVIAAHEVSASGS